MDERDEALKRDRERQRKREELRQKRERTGDKAEEDGYRHRTSCRNTSDC